MLLANISKGLWGPCTYCFWYNNGRTLFDRQCRKQLCFRICLQVDTPPSFSGDAFQIYVCFLDMQLLFRKKSDSKMWTLNFSRLPKCCLKWDIFGLCNTSSIQNTMWGMKWEISDLHMSWFGQNFRGKWATRYTSDRRIPQLLRNIREIWFINICCLTCVENLRGLLQNPAMPTCIRTIRNIFALNSKPKTICLRCFKIIFNIFFSSKNVVATVVIN